MNQVSKETRDRNRNRWNGRRMEIRNVKIVNRGQELGKGNRSEENHMNGHKRECDKKWEWDRSDGISGGNELNKK